jgi:hypothetical protein
MGFHNLRRREASAGSVEAGVSTWAGVLRAAGVHAFATRELRLSYRVPRDVLQAASVLPGIKAGQVVPEALFQAPRFESNQEAVSPARILNRRAPAAIGLATEQRRPDNEVA